MLASLGTRNACSNATKAESVFSGLPQNSETVETVQGRVITTGRNGAVRLKALIRIVMTRHISFIRMIPYARGARGATRPAVHGQLTADFTVARCPNSAKAESVLTVCHRIVKRLKWSGECNYSLGMERRTSIESFDSHRDDAPHLLYSNDPVRPRRARSDAPYL